MRRERLIIDFIVIGDLADFYINLKAKLDEMQRDGDIDDYRILQERIITLVDFSEETKQK